MLDFIVAKTHNPEYLLHKYWARKPSNVLREIIQKLQNGLQLNILDPFCGSGVFISEASKLGNKCIALDINPTAYILTKTTCSPPSVKAFYEHVYPIIKKFEQICDDSYGLIDGEKIRYIVHETVVNCPLCQINSTKSKVNKKGRAYYCPNCGQRLHLNLKNLINTEVTAIQTEKSIIKDAKHLVSQATLSNQVLNEKNNIYDLEFYENKRILSYNGMKTGDLFTSRNFNLICWLANQFHNINDLKIKEAALLLLTASVAQCSRFVAYRNNMTTGGPAWSVPGYWIPPTHLETNPSHHINARFKKFIKGLKALQSNHESKVIVINDDAKNIEKYDIKNIDLVFLDPPYGDSVPYLEFSMIWNSFLKIPFQLSKDISVSDRFNVKKDSWDFYIESLNIIVSNICKKLNQNGKILITFNNHDRRAWEALIKSLHKNNLYCTHTTYQIPAVISSKAQFSIEGSYLSDIYSIYEKRKNPQYLYSFELVIDSIKRCATSRDYKLTKSQLYRTIFLSLIENNIHHKLFKEIDVLIEVHFYLKDGYFYLKEPYRDLNVRYDLRKICLNEFYSLSTNGPFLWKDLYYQIAEKCIQIGIPDPGEVRVLLGDYITFKGSKCIPTKDIAPLAIQGNLF